MTGDGITYLLFDWGDTLMADNPGLEGPMAEWEAVSAMPGVAETLPLLARRYACAVVSNAGASDAAAMERAFGRVGLDGYFSHFYTSKELGAAKPDRRFFEAALGRIGIRPEQACMIGNDYHKDIAGAKDAGIRAVLISGTAGAFPRADAVVPSFWALAEIF